MKNRVYPVVVLLLGLGLASCGASIGSGGSSVSLSGSSSGLRTSYANALPASSQLLVGTIRLEGTADAVDSEQAAELLPLWQAYRSLLSNGTAAQAEFQGLERQIEAVMTSAQIQAIAGLRLTQAEVASVMSEFGSVQATSSGTPQASSQGQAGPGGPPGGFGDGGGGPPAAGELLGPGGGAAGMGSEAQTTATPGQASAGTTSTSSISLQMVSAVIRFLGQAALPSATPAP